MEDFAPSWPDWETKAALSDSGVVEYGVATQVRLRPFDLQTPAEFRVSICRDTNSCNLVVFVFRWVCFTEVANAKFCRI